MAFSLVALTPILIPIIFSIFFTTLFILIVLELKAISRSLSNIEKFIIQSNSKEEDRRHPTSIF